MRMKNLTILGCLTLTLLLGAGAALAQAPAGETMTEEAVLQGMESWGTPVMYPDKPVQGFTFKEGGMETGEDDAVRYFLTYQNDIGDAYTVRFALLGETSAPLKALLEGETQTLEENDLTYCVAEAEGTGTRLYAASADSVAARRDGSAQGLMMVYELTCETLDEGALLKVLEAFSA